ncbi:MAG: ATP-binding protein [Sphingobacteriales bacterium]|nr:MAG: ATP-binding protein [Sphingobacteriales bacterium]
MILSSHVQYNGTILSDKFKLSFDAFVSSSEFEIVFIHEAVRYRYGFEALINEVTSEWLYSQSEKPKSKEIELYYRDKQNVDFHSSLPKVKTLFKEDLVRPNALLISVLAQFNDQLATSLLNYFSKINTVSGLNESEFRINTISKIKDAKQKDRVLELLKSADLGITDIEYLEKPDWLDILPDSSRTFFEQEDLSSVVTKHILFQKENIALGDIKFDMSKDESHGTQKFFYFSGLIIDALENGTPLIVDELDSKLHPNLVCKIVSLFNSKQSNPKNAQLIFNTHDTNLLSSGLFRRDQIWFISKDNYGASKMYSLADFKTTEVRKNEPFEDNYIKGKYGAVPYLGDFDELINKIVSEDGKAE